MSTNITSNDMIDFLSLMAAFDQRDNSADDVRAWLLVAELERWDRDAVKRIVLDHYRVGAEKPRLTPALVSDRHRELRRAAASTFEDPVIPPDLGGVTYPVWYRAQRDKHVAELLKRWAATGEEPRREIEG